MFDNALQSIIIGLGVLFGDDCWIIFWDYFYSFHGVILSLIKDNNLKHTPNKKTCKI